MNFRTSLSISTKKPASVLVRIALNLHINLGRNNILLSLPTPEHNIFRHLFSLLLLAALDLRYGTQNLLL